MIDVDIEQQLGRVSPRRQVRGGGAHRRAVRPLGIGQEQRDQCDRGHRHASARLHSHQRCVAVRCREGHRPAAGSSVGSATCFRTRCCFRTWTWNRICFTGNACALRQIASSTKRESSSCSALAPCCAESRSALSGGEKQRVAIGRALLAQPRILLMDEPLAALDVPRKTEILDYIERLRDELDIPIVYVSHSVAEITRLADTVVVLSDGKMPRGRRRRRSDGSARSQARDGPLRGGIAVDTRVTAHDPRDQLTTLAFDGGELIVPHLDATVGERVRARIRARDVSLALQRPAEISILNVLPGRVTAIDDGDRTDRRCATRGRQRHAHCPHYAPFVRAARNSRRTRALCAGQGRLLRPAQRRLRVASCPCHGQRCARHHRVDQPPRVAVATGPQSCSKIDIAISIARRARSIGAPDCRRWPAMPLRSRSCALRKSALRISCSKSARAPGRSDARCVRCRCATSGSTHRPQCCGSSNSVAARMAVPRQSPSRTQAGPGRRATAASAWCSGRARCICCPCGTSSTNVFALPRHGARTCWSAGSSAIRMAFVRDCGARCATA